MSSASEIEIAVELDPSLAPFADGADPRSRNLRDSLKASLDEMVGLLGIPAEVRVAVRAAADPLADGALLRLSTNGRPCRFPDELLLWVHHYVGGVQGGVEVKPASVTAWVQALVDTDDVAEFVGLLCVEILKIRPALLLPNRLAAAYASSLTDARGGSAAGRVEVDDSYAEVFRTLLELRISLADTERITETLARTAGRSKPEVAEELIAAMASDVIEIQIAEDYLRQITARDPENSQGMFSFLREGMSLETGLVYPPFRFVPVEHLKPGAFCFKVNDLTTLPMVGLAADRLLVNDTPRRLAALGIDGTLSLNPASGQLGSLVALSTAIAAQTNLTTWNDLQYLVLAFADTLRRTAGCFVTLTSVDGLLERWRQETGAEALLFAATSKLPPSQVVRVFRSLAIDGVGVRNSRVMLESLFDYATACEAAGRPVEDAEAVAFVRAGLKWQLRNKYSRGTATVVAYVFDPGIERILAPGTSGMFDEDVQRIRGAVRAALATIPEEAVAPVLLTSAAQRAALREIVHDEFPRLLVASYDELPADTNIQAADRISLS